MLKGTATRNPLFDREQARPPSRSGLSSWDDEQAPGEGAPPPGFLRKRDAEAERLFVLSVLVAPLGRFLPEQPWATRTAQQKKRISWRFSGRLH
jgi:hypothetical protein